MARLALDQAPAPADPARFLSSVPAWGALAGGMLLLEGPALLASRWSPATVALVHVVTLGVLGNALFGSLLQFLPAAAGARVRGGTMLARVLHTLLNAGAAALVAGLWWPLAELRAVGAVGLGLAFALLVAATLPGVVGRAHASLLHAGLSISLVCALATAVLGLMLVAGLAGWWVLPIARWTDLHAATGVVGWMLVLLASVGRVVMPMFQGAPAVPALAQGGWLLGVALGLPLAGLAWIRVEDGGPLRALVAVAASLLAGTWLWLQTRSRKSAPGALAGFWRLGLWALAAAALALWLPGERSVLIGMLGLGIGLPMLVLGMVLEIGAFLGWIGLHRHCGRGRQLPGVHILLPSRTRTRVLRTFGVAALALVLTALWPDPVGTRLAGALLLAAHLALWRAQRGLAGRVRVFATAYPPRLQGTEEIQ